MHAIGQHTKRHGFSISLVIIYFTLDSTIFSLHDILYNLGLTLNTVLNKSFLAYQLVVFYVVVICVAVLAACFQQRLSCWKIQF